MSPVDWYMNSQTTPTATMERMTGRKTRDCRKFLCRISRLPNIMANTKARTLIAATLTALKWSVRRNELITRGSFTMARKFLNPTHLLGGEDVPVEEGEAESAHHRVDEKDREKKIRVGRMNTYPWFCRRVTE